MSNKAREALEEIRSCADYIYSNPNNIGGVQQCARDIMETIDKIASGPLRNCDVGTVEEQMRRWQEFCMMRDSCDECPCHKKSCIITLCFAHWAQMPYKKVK